MGKIASDYNSKISSNCKEKWINCFWWITWQLNCTKDAIAYGEIVCCTCGRHTQNRNTLILYSQEGSFGIKTEVKWGISLGLLFNNQYKELLHREGKVLFKGVLETFFEDFLRSYVGRLYLCLNTMKHIITRFIFSYYKRKPYIRKILKIKKKK